MTRILPTELQEQAVIIAEHARREGLDFYPTVFEMLDSDEISQVAAYGGFPQRYPHWRFGMEYERLRKSHTYGLSRIYEMVINNDPCYAYLLDDNAYVDQKTVMAHVYGHGDFFKNNVWFSKTNRRMMDDMANHATRGPPLHQAVQPGPGGALPGPVPVAGEPDRPALGVHAPHPDAHAGP